MSKFNNLILCELFFLRKSLNCIYIGLYIYIYIYMYIYIYIYLHNIHLYNIAWLPPNTMMS